MKTKLLFACSLLLATCYLVPPAFAKPERIEIKEAGKRIKERGAEAQIKTIDLQNIEDPEARRAIREILNYLNLQAKQ